MADTRCANPEYQLEVDEMTLEYLIYNTLKAHLDEWDPEYRRLSTDETSVRDTASKNQAPTLLAILDTTVHLFKANHPGHPWSKNTAFYFKLLEFLLLFCHGRGGPSVLSEGSCSEAREAGKENVQRRVRCWEACEQLSEILDTADQELLAIRSVDRRGEAPRDQGVSAEDNAQGISLVDLLPLFMELSAEIARLSEADVSNMWLKLACEFMIQAAIEVGSRALTASHGWNTIQKPLLACFGWGLPIAMPEFSLVMGVEDASVAEREKKVHRMLRSIKDKGGSQTASWDYQRRQAIEEVMINMNSDSGNRMDEDDEREHDLRQFLNVQYYHAPEDFEVQVLHYIKDLQAVWAQFNEEPILLQIEQGRLEGLKDDEFTAFMERVGGDEHEANLERIELPAIPRM